MLRQGSSFELVGFDFMVDADLRPFVLEVNLVPSLAKQVPFIFLSTCAARGLILWSLQAIMRAPT